MESNGPLKLFIVDSNGVVSALFELSSTLKSDMNGEEKRRGNTTKIILWVANVLFAKFNEMSTI